MFVGAHFNRRLIGILLDERPPVGVNLGCHGAHLGVRMLSHFVDSVTLEDRGLHDVHQLISVTMAKDLLCLTYTKGCLLLGVMLLLQQCSDAQV